MPSLFHLGWASLLVLLALGLLSRRTSASGWLGTLWQLGLAVGVLAWGASLLGTIAGDHGPGLELETLELTPTAAGAVVLGSSMEHADVLLPDPHAAPVHAVVRWEGGAGAELTPTLWNASSTHRLEVDGVGMHDVELTSRTELSLGRRTLEVAAPGLWPGVLLVDDQGAIHRLRAPVARGLLAFLPVVGPRVSSTLGWLQQEGSGYRLLDHAPLPGTGATALLATRGRAARLAFPTAEDRAEHSVIVHRPGESATRPSERRHELRSGEVLTLGRTRYGVTVEQGGVVSFRVLGAPPRLPWPDKDGSVIDGFGSVLLSGDAAGDRLVAASLTDGVGFRRLDGVSTLGPSGHGRVVVNSGERLAISVGDGARAQLRVAGRAAPAVAFAGLASSLDARFWTLLLILAASYLVVTLVGSRLGYVHARSAGVLHGAA
ncbi:MAG: FHA domain-containing protein, partial [Deltaproteobacteria bacterium]|nr:FHA domain-containing protein [Deltaproteobacteria bacterium]